MSVTENTREMNTLQLPRIPADLPHRLKAVVTDMTEHERRNTLDFLEYLLKNEKRNLSRKHQFIKTTVSCDKKVKSGVIKNLSPGGAFLATRCLYPPGSEITLSFPILNFEFPVTLKAEVIWISSKGMGLKFKINHRLDQRLAAQKIADALASPFSVS